MLPTSKAVTTTAPATAPPIMAPNDEVYSSGELLVSIFVVESLGVLERA